MNGAYDIRLRALEACGATALQVEELLAYGATHFACPTELPPSSLSLPLPPQLHVAAWQSYARNAMKDGAAPELKRRIVQLRFPIGEGVTDSDEYRSATRKGRVPDGMARTSGVVFERPEAIRILLHDSPAGTIPVVAAGARADFVTLVRAIIHRNAPVPVSDATGAYMVSGYNNWDRVGALRTAWESDPGHTEPWSVGFRRMRADRERYQDRFMLVTEGPYSGVDAGPTGLDEPGWLAASLTLRIEHECTHYFTRRVLGSMRGLALDEVLADYMGIVAALGRFDAPLLLHVLGLDPEGGFRPGGRLANYRGDPPLSDGAFTVLQRVVRQAAENLEVFDGDLPVERTPAERGLTLLTLASHSLEEIGSNDGVDRLRETRRVLADRTPTAA